MRVNTNCVLIVAMTVVFATSAAAELPRRAPLGVALGPAQPDQPSNPTDEARVRSTLPGLVAEAIGVKAGDTIVAAGGHDTKTVADVIAYAGTLREGQKVDLLVQRDGKRVPLSGSAIGRPRETYAGATVKYDSVPFRGGQMADIMVTPAGVKDAPVVYLIQGFTCVSVESANPEHPYRRLTQALVDAKIAVYRVEKPGLGDSVGGIDCTKIDYSTELDGFRAAYNHVINDLKMPPERLFILGHSLGGLEAPMLAAERAPRGVAVYGTVLRDWSDYYHDIDVFQSYIANGVDLVDDRARSEANREILRRFFFDHQSPAEIVKAKPALDPNLREIMSWDGGENMMGRSYKYMQELNGLPLIESWKKSKTNVLALYGGSDFVALNNIDHKLIADLANFYRPGSGTFIEVPDTGHGMDLIGSLPEARRKAMSGQPGPPAPFNPKVADALIGWIKACLAKPPVA